MALLDELPEEVENGLRSLRLLGQLDAEPPIADLDAGDDGGSRRIIAFATDLDHSGRFGREWLVVRRGYLYVFTPNGGREAVLKTAVPLERVREVTADFYVGNGLLKVRTDAETIPLVRYSQALVSDANICARQISSLLRHQEPKWEDVEERQRFCPKCGRALPEDSDVCQACLNKRAVLLRLFQFLRPYKLVVAAGLVILIGTSLTDLAPPYIGGRIVDALVTGRHAPGPTMVRVAMLVGLMAIVRLVAGALQYGGRRISAWLGARTLMDIRIAIFTRLTRLSLGYFDKRSVGSVMARITNDADNLWDFLTDGAPWLLTNVLSLGFTSFVLFRMNARLAFYLLAPAPFIFILTRWFMPRARRRFRMVWHRISKMYSALNSALSGIKVIKAFAQEDRENRRFTDRNRRVFEASFAANAMWAVYFPLLGLLMSLGSYIIWLAGGYQVLHGTMTLGTLTAFSGYLMQFYAPFQNFSRALDWSTRSMTAAERVFEVLDTEPDVRDMGTAIAMPRIEGAVEFDHVSFSYDKARNVLEDFTLKVEPGEMIGLVGPTGAGKTTVINLLARFYDVTQGAILVDGVDIRRIRQEDFRRQLGIVPQEPFLFPGTIRENIAYAKPGASDREIMRAAKAANAHEFILGFPDGYDTQVGERGQRLSGGERQRISIARAILHDPRILILDEATASVDTETEQLIQEAITRLVQNRTTFAIAHRLSTLRHASRLVVLQEGKMVECGTHDELMELNGVYAHLVQIQTEVNRIRAV